MPKKKQIEGPKMKNLSKMSNFWGTLSRKKSNNLNFTFSLKKYEVLEQIVSFEITLAWPYRFSTLLQTSSSLRQTRIIALQTVFQTIAQLSRSKNNPKTSSHCEKHISDKMPKHPVSSETDALYRKTVA